MRVIHLLTGLHFLCYMFADIFPWLDSMAQNSRNTFKYFGLLHLNVSK